VRQALQTRLPPLRDLLGDEKGQEVADAPVLGFGALDEIAPDAPGVGEVESLQQGIEIDVAWAHRARLLCAGIALGVGDGR